MKLYYPITVDLSQPYPVRKMTVPQNNIGRGASITLTWTGIVMDPANEVVELFAKRPDGYISYLPCTVEQGKVIADFTPEMLSAPGTVQVELQMLHEAEEITTPIFMIEVQRSNIDAREVLGSDDFKAFKDALDEVEELKKNGLKGDPGKAATIQVGSVTASDPGGAAAVSNSGTAQAAIFDFVLPRGIPGPKGPQGTVDTDGAIEFNDYEAEGAVVPEEETALAGIASGSSLKNVISNIKAFSVGAWKTIKALKYAAGILYNLGTEDAPNYKDLQTVIGDLSANMNGILNSRIINFNPVEQNIGISESRQSDLLIEFPYVYSANANGLQTKIQISSNNYYVIGKIDGSDIYHLVVPQRFISIPVLILSIKNYLAAGASMGILGIYFDGTNTYLASSNDLKFNIEYADSLYILPLYVNPVMYNSHN